MKILRIVLAIGGLMLIGFGLYHALVPASFYEVSDSVSGVRTEGFTNQTIGMMGIGVLALLAASAMKSRR